MHETGEWHLDDTSDPTARRYTTRTPGVGGVIKGTPDDFLVDELPITEPSGRGEHLYLRVQKRGLSHGELVRLIAKHFRVSMRAIGYAGMKDKRAVTSQAITVHTPADYDGSTIDPHVTVLWADRHARKLRRGHLRGNRFAIRIRNVDPLKAPTVARTLEALECDGVPNYFGHQRFGYRRNNHVLGSQLLKRDWDGLLDELLGTGTPFPLHQRAARAAYERGAFAEAARGFGRGSDAERRALFALHRGQSARRAVLGTTRRALGFWANAAQSAIFNRLLDARIDAGMLGSLEVGDLAWKHDSRAVFAVDEDVLRSSDTPERLQRLEISPSGPLWAADMTRAAGAVHARELRALTLHGLAEEDLVDPPCRVNGARRSFRVPIGYPQLESGVDESGAYMRVAFELPRGSYATVVLREIMKVDDLEGRQALVHEHAEESEPDGDGD